METTKRLSILNIQHNNIQHKLQSLKDNYLFIQYLITCHLLDNTSLDDIREIEDHADNLVADSGKFQIKLLEFEFPYFKQTFIDISFYYDNMKRMIRMIKMHKIKNNNVNALHCSDLRQYHLKPFSGVNRVHSDNIYQFLTSLFQYFENRKTLPENRGLILAKFLRGSAKGAFERLNKTDQDDFSKIQNTLIKIFGNQHKLIRCYERFHESIGPIPTAIGDNINHHNILRKAKGHLKLLMKYEAIFAFHQQTIPTSIIFNFNFNYLQPENKNTCNNIKDIMQAVQTTITNSEQALIYSP